jgi:ADP-ribose pyrophosphatase
VSLEPDSSRRVYQGRLLGLTVERWGENEREIVEHPGAVAMVAVDAEGYVTLVRQLREATRKRLLEIPAGTVEPGERPLETAKRELQEECGLTGGEWRELAAFWTTPGFCRERMHVFAVEGAERGVATPDDDEELELVRWPVAEIGQRLHEIEDAKTLAGLLLYLSTPPGRPGASWRALHAPTQGGDRSRRPSRATLPAKACRSRAFAS